MSTGYIISNERLLEEGRSLRCSQPDSLARAYSDAGAGDSAAWAHSFSGDSGSWGCHD